MSALFIVGYFILASIGGAMCFLATSLKKESQIVASLALIFVPLVFIALALLCLGQEDKFKNFDDFIEKLNKANEKYKDIKKPRMILLLDGNGQST